MCAKDTEKAWSLPGRDVCEPALTDSVSLCLCLKQAARSAYKVTKQQSGSLKSPMRSVAWDSFQKCRAYRRVSRAIVVFVKSSDC